MQLDVCQLQHAHVITYSWRRLCKATICSLSIYGLRATVCMLQYNMRFDDHAQQKDFASTSLGHACVCRTCTSTAADSAVIL